MFDLQRPGAAGGRHTLPGYRTRFIGRTRELTSIHHGIRRHRVLTLTGAAGCGKSRLAVEAASRMLDQFAGRVRLLERAAFSAGAERSVSSAPSLFRAGIAASDLEGRQGLLVLDGVGPWQWEAALLEGLLLTYPRLKALVVSERVLGLPGEWALPVPPLSLPPLFRPSEEAGTADVGPEAVPPEEWMPLLWRSEAVRLFVDRASVARPGFGPTPHNGPLVAEICCRLHGMPLAIEVCAAQTRALSTRQILSSLRQEFCLPGREVPRSTVLRGWRWISRSHSG